MISSGARVPKAVLVVLPTPATLPEPVILALAFPLDHFSNVERGDLLPIHITLLRLHALEGTLLNSEHVTIVFRD